MDRFQIYLIKPTRYDDDGYPLQWWRSIIPSNSLACLTGIVEDAIALGGEEADLHVTDEIHSHVDPARIIRDIRAKGGRGFIGLVGVQTNQYPRAMDLAHEFRAAGLPVCIGGFHVSGCISMLKQMPPELEEALELEHLALCRRIRGRPDRRGAAGCARRRAQADLQSPR